MITESCHNPVMRQMIQDEQFTNVQRAPAGLTRLFLKAARSGTFYRVLKNDKPLGVLIPNRMWEDLLEDLEALSSPRYLKAIAKARRETKSYSLDEVKKKLNL